jgi:hypothetical protein
MHSLKRPAQDLILPQERRYDLKDGTSRRCYASSAKSGNGPFWLQSLAMALYVRERDIDPETVWIKSEPGLMLVNEGVHEGEHPFKYWPDFEVGYRGGRISVVEIKSAGRRDDLALKARMERVRRQCREADREFELIFSDRLYREPKRRNVALIHYYKDFPVTEADRQQILRQLEREPEMRIADLLRACPQITAPQVYALTAKGLLWVNLFKPVDGSAVVRRPRRSIADPA